MKNIHNILTLALLLALTTTSCLDSKESYNAGFFFRKPLYVVNPVYANTVADTISFVSYGNWSVSRTDNSLWLTFSATSGHDNTTYTFPVAFEQNTTGQGRGAQIVFSDTDHPDEARATVVYWQYATRGDGTLGSAADVKAISGSDGSRFELSYDGQHRPLSLRITRDATLLRSITIAYDDYDSLLTVQDGGVRLTSSFGPDCQPQQLIGSGDTVAYMSQYDASGMPVAFNYAFNLKHTTYTGDNVYYAYLLGGQSLSADSLHVADSLRIARVGATTGSKVERYKLSYSALDNRCQSVDVNQLILGTDGCDPYQLLSLFRHCRSSRVVSELSGNATTLTVAASRNADGSISRLEVSRKTAADGHTEQPLVYNFKY